MPGKVDILVVDDDAEVREKVSATLSDGDYRCIHAANAGQALRKLARSSFDLVFLDLSLPGATGTDLAGEMMSRCPDTALIVITMIDEVALAVQCMKAGAADYLVKPVEPDKLRASVSRALKIRSEKLSFREYQRGLEKTVREEKELRTQFLHSLAHEIKTPLTVIVSSSEMLGAESQPEALVRKMADSVRRSACTLNQKVNELATLDKVDGTEPGDEPPPLDARFVIREVSKLVSEPLRSRAQSLSLEIAGQLPVIKMRDNEFRQVLLSLISNASKFSPDGSHVVLRAKDSGNGIMVQVEDEAAPIPEGEKRRIFDLYYRGEDEDRINRVPGLGIGLYVVKQIVEKYGGEIRVNNRLKRATYSRSLSRAGRLTAEKGPRTGCRKHRTGTAIRAGRHRPAHTRAAGRNLLHPTETRGRYDAISTQNSAGQRRL